MPCTVLIFPSWCAGSYDDGVRIFVEVGPGASCSRLIGEILSGKPQLAASASPGEAAPFTSFLMLLARLIAERSPVDLTPLYGRDFPGKSESKARSLKIPIGGLPFRPPPIPPRTPTLDRGPSPVPSRSESSLVTLSNPLFASVYATEAARGEAQAAYLTVAGGMSHLIARQIDFQMGLIDQFDPEFAIGTSLATLEGPPRSLDRESCLEFAVGSIGAVLGPDFAEIDAHPTRVRLPDEPLMLVDRIIEIEGSPRSMTSGRVVTEHDVLPDAWYLDAGRIPTCIAVEAGQADLFLSAFLGIDFETKGKAVYRLLDALVTFHRSLPEVGDVIRYDIAIDSFFRQGDSRLFRFRFEATVDGKPLMSMTDGVAGFFTEEALNAGQGVVKTALDLRPIPGIRPGDWRPLVPMEDQALDENQVEALRSGDLVGAFGPLFEGLPIHQAAPLPGGLMRLVERVISIEPEGGRYGLGRIVAEADIDPQAWFMTCHFVDDRVMPGTLMYECCLAHVADLPDEDGLDRRGRDRRLPAGARSQRQAQVSRTGAGVNR